MGCTGTVVVRLGDALPRFRHHFVLAPAKHAGWASPGATDDNYVLELQSTSRTDMGLEGVAESDLAAKVTLVIGEPIHADCVLENARGCPADLSPFVVAASAATSVALDPATFGETSAVRWTFNGAKVRTAIGHRSVTTPAIHEAASALTSLMPAVRWGPSASKKPRSVAPSRPGPARTSRPVSWLTTTVK